MKRIKSFTSLSLLLLCLLAGLSPVPVKDVSAQAEPQTTTDIPGVPPGYTLIEDDIQMPLGVINALRGQGQYLRSWPQATFTTQLWPNGIVPYRFERTCAATSTCFGAPQSGCVSAANQAAMLSSMAAIQAVANVRFQRCANDDCGPGNPTHVLIRDSTNDTTVGANNTCQNAARNSSPVGRQGGGQIINITSWGTGAPDQFIRVHELLHTLGFFHEHTRADRDTFVDIAALCANVQGGCMGNTYLNNFPVASGATVYGGYDFDSVMHYGQCSFSRGGNCPADGLITVRVKAPYNTQNSPDGVQWQNAIGQRQRLSELDRLTVSFLYPQPNWRFVDARYTGGNGAPDGTFLRPYQSLATGINATPVGGVLWLQPGTYFADGPLTKAITLRAPLGNAEIRRRTSAVGETLATVSAAAYNGELASEAIASAFGIGLADSTAVATALPLPTTLAGTTVTVKDSAGVEHAAPLFFVSPGQINYLIPNGTASGIASVIVQKGRAVVARGTLPVAAVAPGLFTANATGQGVAAAVALRVRANGSQNVEPVARFDQQSGRFVSVPIDLGPEDEQVFLILFGTGFRARSGLEASAVNIGGEAAEVLFAGGLSSFAGLDQANVRLPRSLAGKGEVSILFTVDNRSANEVTVSIR